MTDYLKSENNLREQMIWFVFTCSIVHFRSKSILHDIIFIYHAETTSIKFKYSTNYRLFYPLMYEFRKYLVLWCNELNKFIGSYSENWEISLLANDI